ncbi:SpoIID/LytB domain-containing protein [Nigerium massiliense]|uniref:SpoIID/LytB domain-containing protein n=1 Tax=Nigerium massiliense TaxID=1522317 RepID=UPI0006942B0F|nr:SpoIID/LytB domain-containing protein [Nigerium massiliense]
MSHAFSPLLRRGAAVASAALLVTTLGPVSGAHADPAQPVYADTITVTGAGYGHGIGMSQYGAQGAARSGLTSAQILSFYYPGTTLVSLPSGNVMRVLISADNDGDASVLPASGLRLIDDAGKAQALPVGAGYSRWRARIVGGARVAEYRDAAGAWKPFPVSLTAGKTWHFENPSAGFVSLLLPNGTVRDYRGKITVRATSKAVTVNTLPMEQYLRAVVPAEMPSGWHAQALGAQAVAARTFAARARTLAGANAAYDTCDTTNCQVYSGLGVRANAQSGRSTVEAASTTAAIGATSNRVLQYGSSLALTMFSSSNGGHTAAGGAAYLVAKPDPYDGRVSNRSWTAALTRAQIEKAYPAIGTLRNAQVLSRDGKGRWGGRVNTIRFSGTKGYQDVAGTALRFKFGLRSHLFNVTGGLKPGSATYQRWAATGLATGSLGAPTTTERTSRGFAEVRFEKGDLGWSSSGGAHIVSSPVLGMWRSLGGIDSVLGAPTTDLVAGPVAKSSKTLFTNGGLYYSAASGAHEVHGPLHHTYVPRAARLGLPLKDTTPAAYVPGASYSWFQKGAIYFHASTGAHAIERPALTAYGSIGYEKSRLGLPTASTTATSTGTITRFQRGTITCTVAGSCKIS